MGEGRKQQFDPVSAKTRIAPDAALKIRHRLLDCDDFTKVYTAHGHTALVHLEPVIALLIDMADVNYRHSMLIVSPDMLEQAEDRRTDVVLWDVMAITT